MSLHDPALCSARNLTDNHVAFDLQPLSFKEIPRNGLALYGSLGYDFGKLNNLHILSPTDILVVSGNVAQLIGQSYISVVLISF